MRRLVTVLGLGVLALLLVEAGNGHADSSAAEAASRPTTDGIELADTVGNASTAARRAQSPPEPEFIELSYYETLESTTNPAPTNCQSPEPGVTVCDTSWTAILVGTHIGRAIDTASGTVRILSSEPCDLSDGTTGFRAVSEAEGTIETAWGDELYFRTHTETCALGPDEFEQTGNWIVTGGTGRFEDASGTMSNFGTSTIPNTSVGTLRVRADLWESLLPGPAPLVISPGAVGIEEGDDGQVVVEVPVTLSHAADEPVTVDWATLDTGAPGIATADVDYVADSGGVTFAPGETTQTVSITVNGDTLVEPPALYGEWGLVEFSNPSPNATLDTSFSGLGVFIIVDDD